MHELAYGSMFSSMETKETLVQNSLGGLAQVREATVTGSGFRPAVVPKGLLKRVDQVSRCSYFVTCWENEALSRVTIKNTGTVRADYVLRAYYDRISSWGMQYDVFWLDSMRDPTTGETIGWVTLEPNQEKTVEVLYKTAADGRDMRPNDGDDITLVLSAVTLDGFYYSDARLDYFTPTKEPLNGQMVEAAELAASATLPYPLSTQVASGPGEQDSTITIQVQNPFAYPVTASLQQPLPQDLTLVSPGGGAVDANGITWQQTVEPHAWVDLSYAVRNDRQDRADIVVSGAQLTLYTLESTGTFNFTGAAVTIRYLKVVECNPSTNQAALFAMSTLAARVSSWISATTLCPQRWLPWATITLNRSESAPMSRLAYFKMMASEDAPRLSWPTTQTWATT